MGYSKCLIDFFEAFDNVAYFMLSSVFSLHAPYFKPQK